MRVLAFFYIVEGVFYLAYSFWRMVVNPLEFYRAPPPLEFMAYVFLLLMFTAGVFFVSRSFRLLKIGKPSKTDLIAVVCSMPLWAVPALFALGNANTYLTSPSIPEELRSYGFYYLRVGIMFMAVGIINLLSLFYLLFFKAVPKRPS